MHFGLNFKSGGREVSCVCRFKDQIKHLELASMILLGPFQVSVFCDTSENPSEPKFFNYQVLINLLLHLVYSTMTQRFSGITSKWQNGYQSLPAWTRRCSIDGRLLLEFCITILLQ